MGPVFATHLEANLLRQRTTNVDPHVRESRLGSFIEPVRQAWQNEEFKNLASSFSGFCQLLGLEEVGPYMQTREAQKMPDWGAVPLDETGKGIQEQMTKRFQVYRFLFSIFLSWYTDAHNSNCLCEEQRHCLPSQQRSLSERIQRMNWHVLFGAIQFRSFFLRCCSWLGKKCHLSFLLYHLTHE